jgi:hypothetical protein
MTHRDVETRLVHVLRQLPASAPHTVGPPQTDRSENRGGYPFPPQIGGDAIVETKSGRHLHRWGEMTRARQSQQKRLHAAVEISAVQM